MRASVVIRVRDEVTALTEVLARLERQTATHQVVVVDNASCDGSGEAARAAGAEVVGISAAEFSFGRALNRGAARTEAEVVVAAKKISHEQEPLAARVHLTRILIRKHVYLILVA